ncbi:uncharacterized protein TNCV_3272491 [Trichonephila clavipes]|nr:uncharacterized protein TNCV_3272491 [Trichonephila clavipes]
MSLTFCNHICCHSCNGFRSHFSTRQCSASHDKSVTRLSPHCYYPSWPAPFPYSSPIEPIWDHFGRRVEYPTSLNELETRVQQIWNEMSQDIIQNLYASMADRIALCIRSKGGSTGYSRAFGDGPRNFEPWSSDEDDTLARAPSLNYYTTPMGGRLNSRQI